MQIQQKKAHTLLQTERHLSTNELISPRGEIQKLLSKSPLQKDKLNENRISKTALHDSKKSRNIAMDLQMKKLNIQRRLAKLFRKVYLITIFLSINQQYDKKIVNVRFNQRKYDYLIYPNDNFKKFWDIFMLFILIYSSIYIPYVVAFENNRKAYEVTQYVFSVIFSTDLIVLTRMCYYDKHNNLVQDQTKIFLNYLKGWLMIDVISIIPIPFCQLIKVIRIKRVQEIISSSSLNQNKLIEFWFNFLDLQKATLFQILFFSVIGFHYATCLWAISIQYSQQHVPNYLEAVYWAMQTLSTTGYGDSIPTTPFEYLCAIIGTFSGGIFMSLIIGNSRRILDDMDTESHFNKTANLYKTLFNQINIFPEYKDRINRFLLVNHKQNLSWTLIQEEWFNLIPRDIQNKILLFVARKELLKISLFRISIPFSLKIIRHISLMKAKAGEFIWLKGDPVDEIYFLIEGLVQYRNQFGKPLLQIKKGVIFGEQEYFLKKQVIQVQQQRQHYAMAIQDCYYLIINKQNFFVNLKEFQALQQYLSILALHRLDQMNIQYKQYEIQANKIRLNQQKLELIKQANRIEIRNCFLVPNHDQNIIYETRQSNTEGILDKLLNNKKSKILMLMDRFRKVVQMIIFANRTFEMKLKKQKAKQLKRKVKPHQIVPIGVLIKIRQKFIHIQNVKKIALEKKNEFNKIVQALSLSKIQNQGCFRRLSSSKSEQTKYGIILNHNPHKLLNDFFQQMGVLENSLALSQWLVREIQKDINNELIVINQVFENNDLIRSQ
ncbi:unnamed protein product (macronuclear) [Paramecium tetraurelia]|uniref:Cyclic nucleotide-binding domain-containing protein n=1 Tax=Paramecium tetraurelia TaxID=5888 RepID=A0CL40_PARTE|nr:uncharacterized protein GSPATT00008054001 [Paramecium tetraurelia]CAK71507.1 unnamed protein product [Paramecium tetraurelia]|eukprot:XP_001438904.1 hypothetical protein (macronuclear) [Paramecium tetraurelia strain d4-2]